MLSEDVEENTMQGLKVLPSIIDEIARVNEIVNGWTHGQMENWTLMLHNANNVKKNSVLS